MNYEDAKKLFETLDFAIDVLDDGAKRDQSSYAGRCIEATRSLASIRDGSLFDNFRKELEAHLAAARVVAKLPGPIFFLCPIEVNPHVVYAHTDITMEVETDEQARNIMRRVVECEYHRDAQRSQRYNGSFMSMDWFDDIMTDRKREEHKGLRGEQNAYWAEVKGIVKYTIYHAYVRVDDDIARISVKVTKSGYNSYVVMDPTGYRRQKIKSNHLQTPDSHFKKSMMGHDSGGKHPIDWTLFFE